MKVLLEDAEIEQAVKVNQSPFAEEVLTQAELAYIQRKAVARAQLIKLYKWGEEDCPHNHTTRLRVKRGCIACWQVLLKEIEDA